MVFIGVDGCRSGWFFVRLKGASMEAGVASRFCEIIAATTDGSSVFVDIPIGLRDSCAIPRGCDTAARKLLGPKRASSVFPAPIRAVLYETNYSAASAKSRRLMGKGLSQQAFAIVPKIREVDELLWTSERARRMVREVHPELCFWGLNSGQAMVHRKKTMDGYTERMAVLTRVLPGSDDVAADALRQYLRKEVARDDIADALVAVATAVASTESLRTAPPVPERDSTGLPMEMVYSGTGLGHAY